jgi:hypothetical protein
MIPLKKRLVFASIKESILGANFAWEKPFWLKMRSRNNNGIEVLLSIEVRIINCDLY